MIKYTKIMGIIFIFCISSVLAEENTEAVEEDVLSAQEFLNGCKEGASPGAPNQYCMQYVFGLVQTLDMLQQSGESQKIFCINPHKVRLEDVTDNITTWVSQKENRLNEDAYVLVTEALHEMYPCQIIDV